LVRVIVGNRWVARLRRAAAIQVIAVTLVATNCGNKAANAPGASDPEDASVAEYDVARDLWLRQDRPRDALEHALKAVELDEDNAEAQHLVGLLYLDFCRRTSHECRLPEAERFTRQALAAQSDFREARNTLGVVLIHAKRYDEAIATLKPLTADILYTTPENAWGNLGWAYLEKGRLDLAIDALRRSVAAQPQFCVGNFRLGLAHEKKREFAAALEAFTRALETNHPDCRSLQEAYAGRARVELGLGRPDEARADLERCFQLHEKSDAGKECGSMLRKLK
jgi:tetratricopeptide (TPR) repeat protein